jgi:hypothetical protein
MLLVIAIGFGREVIQWWHSGPAAKPRDSGQTELPAGGTESQILQFGDQSWSIRRQEFLGPREAVPAALQAVCRSAIVTAQPRNSKPDAAEQNVLTRLASEQAVAEEVGKWRLYQWSEGFPILIGTRAVAVDSSQSAGPEAGTNLAETTHRVVIWGMAVPVAADAWTLYVFQADRAPGSQATAAVEIPLPRAARRVAAIRSVGGEAITAFSLGDEGVVRARQHFDGWFAMHDWNAVGPWQPISTGWHARFESKSQSSFRAVDIRLGVDSQGKLTGLLLESQVEKGTR